MPTPAEELTLLQQRLDRCDPEALLDLLDASRERTIRRLRQAVRKLRADYEAQAATHERLAALLTGRGTHEAD
jgi:hypothetical protein